MRSQSIRLANSDELIVNEMIFGECNHRDWVKSADQFNCVSLTCTCCGDEFHYHGKDQVPLLTEKEFLLSQIRKYSEDVVANITFRRIESAGWRALVEHRAGKFVCTFQRGGKKFSSDSATSSGSAICDAAARLGSSGDFNGPVPFV